ncbi:alpha/beta fold hydrolase [Wenzhouxiangella sp. AB-CW3]|uniref:alpha/beta hydrolase family protein n=1 Tax=Wenzhouxiangella sp. AB-CW3 TaxID=2771012 RepID=UPI00168A8DC4|nr:alpha/beta fold hydrolase [Wenzhouxiangella sp. AB-CW3]QOC21902.1 alpha/beta fold hydrolase [Wenzhouxiangella sp. AB-CW3]
MPHPQPVVPIKTKDDHRFELIHVPAEQPRHTLFFLPGMGLSARHYIDFGQALAEHGIEVFIHEWRGIGSSNVRAARICDWGYRELLELDLFDALATIHDYSNRQRLIIAGHSLGAQFACLLGAMKPDRCDALALIAGGSPYWRLFDWKMKLVMVAVMFGFPLIAGVRGHYPGKSLGFAGREARGVISDWTRSARTGEYHPSGVATDLEAGMRDLAVPAIGMNMAADWFVPDASLHWLTGKLTQCRVEHYTIKASDEFPADHYAWMKQPDATVSHLLNWMAHYSIIQ